MGISVERQFAALLYAVYTGAFFGVLYDLVRIIRVLSGVSEYTAAGKRLYACALPLIGLVRSTASSSNYRFGRWIALFVSDLIFGTAAGCVFSVFLYYAASGCFRWFYLLGCGLGFCFYYLTIGRLVMLSSEVIVFALKTVLRYLVWLLCVPVRFLRWLLYRGGTGAYTYICAPICEYFRRLHLRMYTRRVRRQLSTVIRISFSDLA